MSRRILDAGRLARPMALLAATGLAFGGLTGAAPAHAQVEYASITGSGSTWSANMIEQWVSDVRNAGIPVSFSATGSSAGRNDFRAGTVDFAVTEIPYGLADATGAPDEPPSRGFAYLPIVAGGTSFMYNLRIGGQQVTNLRLSGDTVARIFTRQITRWDDPAILEDNPNLALPARDIVPVVRSDGSGTTAQFTTWLSQQYPQIWGDFCTRQNLSLCTFTSNWPAGGGGFVAQAGSLGVSGYVASPSAEGAITYVEYSYALNNQFPVAKIRNASDFYTEPTDNNVAVSLLRARIETGNRDPRVYLTQDLSGVYNDDDDRSYPLSSYSYIVIPTAEGGTFRDDKGRSMSDFLNYALCQGQRVAPQLGYSPLPQNLVVAGFEQIARIPGAGPQATNIAACGNPTFSATGENTLALEAPQPQACDRVGTAQCTSGTAGAAGTATAVSRGTGPQGEQAGGGGEDGGDGGAAGEAAGGGGATGAGAVPGAGPGATGGADAAAVGADGLPAGDAAGGPVIDPETGEVVAAGGTGAGGPGGVGFVSGVPVSAPGGSGWQLQHTLMVLSALALLVATLGPPLLLRRLQRGGAS